MELSPRVQVQRAPDGSWYLTLTIKGFNGLREVEKFLKNLPKIVIQATGEQLVIETFAEVPE